MERAILVGRAPQSTPRSEIESSLDELARLLVSAGAVEAGRIIQRGRPHAAHLIGTGKLDEADRLAADTGADFIVFDDELTPSQIANIEKRLDRKVIDRSMLILSIFAKHARTKEAMTQVELAQYEYLYPRLTGQWSHMTRHVGGIGTRGPGETQLETDRRLVGKRIRHLKRRLEAIDRERAVQRRGRQAMFKVAMVGYTNAGKSTLFNRLTRADVWTADLLFCTLDPTARALAHGSGRRVILTDTIGFIRKLPASLFAAFRATLDEVTSADMILLVLDYSDPNHPAALAEVRSTLAAIKADQIPRLIVLNKIDLLDGRPTEPFGVDEPGEATLAVSATTGVGVDRLVQAILSRAPTRNDAEGPRRARTARARVYFERRPSD